MATLEGRSVASSYKDLLQVSNANTGIDGTPRLVSDGQGTDSILYLSTDKVGVGGTPTSHLEIISAGTDSQTSLVISGYNDQIEKNPELVLRKSHSDTSGTVSATPNDTILGVIKFSGVDSSDGYDNGVTITAEQNGSANAKLPTDLKFVTNSPTTANTDQLVLHHDGGIAMGTDNPNGTLHVHTATAGSVNAPSVSDDLVVENNDNAGITILTPDDKMGTLGFGSPSDSIAGMVRYDETNKSMIFGTVEDTSAGNIKFLTANEVTAMTIDSSQRVGIGTSSSSDYDAGADNLVVYDSGIAGITIAGGTTGQSNIHFGDGTGASSYRGVIQYVHSNDEMRFWSNGSRKLTLNSSGDLDFNGNYVVDEQGRQNHVSNTMSSPYYRTDGVDDFLSHTNTTLLDVFTNNDDVSFEVLFKMPNTLNEQLFSYGINSSNFIQFFTIAGDLAYRTAGHGDSSLRHKVNQTLFEAGKIYHLAITMVAGSHPTIYVNGNAISFTPVSQSSDDAISNSGLQIGRGQLSSPAYGEFEFYRFKAFNLALDATEVKELYSGMSVPYKYKSANQTNLFGSLDFTSGWSAVNASITDSDTFASTSANGYLSRNFGAGDIGKQYRLRIAGTVSAGILQVQNVNGSSNILTGLSGTFDQTTEYTYAGTDDQPAIIRLTSNGATADITHFSLVRIGAVYEYDGSGIASDKWFDKSGNDKHLTVSGATVENAPSDDDGLVYDSGTWTPAFDNLTEGNATISGFYKRIGDLVYVQGEIVWGSSTSASGATAINNLPFTISNDIEPFGNAYITDSGTASYFGKVQGTVNSTTLLLQEQNSGGSGNPVSAGSITEASPFTWTTNDVFKFEITYRTA